VLDLSGDSGVFTWEALRQTPEGGLWSLVRSQPAAQLLREQSQNLPDLRRPAILIGEPRELPGLLAAQEQGTVRFDAIIGRNILCSSHDRLGLAASLPAWLTPSGRICLLENIPRRGQRLSEFLPAGQDEWRQQLQSAEEKVYCDSQDAWLSWDENTLLQELSQTTALTWQMEVLSFHREQIISAAQLQHWFAERNGSYAERLRRAGLSQQDVLRLRDSLPVGRPLPWHSTVAVLFGRTAK